MTTEFPCQPIFTSQDIKKIFALILYLFLITCTTVKKSETQAENI